uniref:Uncharacterized protein n=1 Tax=Meloidogyne incognita TaxID=6306 RepID=A0A914LLW6_MELIC
MMTGSMILSKLEIKNLENDHLILTTYGKIVEIKKNVIDLDFINCWRYEIQVKLSPMYRSVVNAKCTAEPLDRLPNVQPPKQPLSLYEQHRKLMDSPFLEQLQSMLEQTTPFSEQHSSILEHPLLMEELAPLKQLPPSQEHLPPLYKICLFYHSMFVFLFYEPNVYDDIDKINIINERILAFQHTMSEQNYTNLLNNADLNLFNQSIFQNIIELYESYFSEFNFLLKFCRETSIVERNLFIFWNVLAFTRKLIRSFVDHQYLDNCNNNINYYDQILYQRWTKDNENKRRKNALYSNDFNISTYAST